MARNFAAEIGAGTFECVAEMGRRCVRICDWCSYFDDLVVWKFLQRVFFLCFLSKFIRHRRLSMRICAGSYKSMRGTFKLLRLHLKPKAMLEWPNESGHRRTVFGATLYMLEPYQSSFI